MEKTLHRASLLVMLSVALLFLIAWRALVFVYRGL